MLADVEQVESRYVSRANQIQFEGRPASANAEAPTDDAPVEALVNEPGLDTALTPTQRATSLHARMSEPLCTIEPFRGARRMPKKVFTPASTRPCDVAGEITGVRRVQDISWLEAIS